MKNNIKNMFDSICNEYDFINDIITFRMHRIWKNDIKKLVHVLKPKKNIRCCYRNCRYCNRTQRCY